jgi:uncharacterized protein
MLTKKSAINRVENFAKEIKLTGIHLRKVILFGSYAKNKQHKWSDIDVALVADEFCGVGFMDIDFFARISIKKPYILIESKTYPTSYFKKGDPFIDEIKRTGIEIKI